MWRLSVEQYHEMIQRGILTDEDPIELIEGWLVTKRPNDPPHTYTRDCLAHYLEERSPEGGIVRRQDPITTRDSEPEPDIALAKGNRRDYLHRHPSPADVALVVEVAESTSDGIAC